MSPSELEEYLLEEPFRPVRLVLASGHDLIIHHRSEALVSGLSVLIGRAVGSSRIPGYYRLVSIPNIVYVERSSLLPPPTGKRRGRTR